MTDQLESHLVELWPDPSLRRFIQGHVVLRASEGKLNRFLRKKLRTVAGHEAALETYRTGAEGEIGISILAHFERHLERLRTERDIIEAALEFLEEVR